MSRGYAGEQELPAIVDFINMCDAHDRMEEGTSIEEMIAEFSTPGYDTARDVRVWYDADGAIVAFGQLWAIDENDDNDGFLWYRIHPNLQGDGIDGQLFAWADARLRELGRVLLRVVTMPHERWRIAAYEQHGFAPVRFYLRLRRQLDTPFDTPQFPAGYSVIDGDHDPQMWAELYNESFVDHFNFHRHTAEQVAHWQSEPDYRSDLNLIALAPDGTPAALAWCGINEADNARTGRRDGVVNLLGTRRGHRRRGLGRAMLLTALERLRAAGMDAARLGVDADSPTGATRLYESVGFEESQRRILYSRAV
jgi:GNAT superfamily N-acetyltransferase